MWIFLGIVMALVATEIVLSFTLKRVYGRWRKASRRILLPCRRPPPNLGAYLYAPKSAHGRLILPSAPLGLLYWYLDWKRWKKEENERQEKRARELPDLIPLAKSVIAKHGTNAESRRSPEALVEWIYDFSEQFPRKSARERLEDQLAKDDLEPQWYKDLRRRASKLGISMEEMDERDIRRAREVHYPRTPCLSNEEVNSLLEKRDLPAERLEHLHACNLCQGLVAMLGEEK